MRNIKSFFAALGLGLGLALSGAVQAEPVKPLRFDQSSELGSSWWRQPDLLSFGIGRFDALRDNDRTNRAIDFRAEFRSGLSLLPLIAPQTFSGWDRYFQVRPMGGVEATSDGAMYGFGGFVYDVFLTPNIFLSPSTVVGLFYRGNGKRLGSFVEFRSTMEAGYRFDNNMRLSLSIGHISNAGLSEYNPGTEIIAGHVAIPTEWIFSR
jgi:lipid A 3-O-deacylase